MGRSWDCDPRRAITPASGLIALAFGVAWWGAAEAQTAPEGRDRFTLEVRGTVVHDTNVAGGNEQFAAARGVSLSDTLYQPAVSLVLRQPLGRSTFFVQANGDLQRYDRNKNLNGDDLDLLAGVRSRFGACNATLTGGYTRRLTPGAELLVPVSKNESDQKFVDLSATCATGRFVEGAQARYSRYDNSADAAGLTNYDSKSVTGTLGYGGRALGDLSLLVQYNDVNYDIPAFNLFPVASGYKAYSYGIRYFRKIGYRLSGTADLTYTKAKTDFSPGLFFTFASRRFSGSSADIAMQYRLGPRTQLDFAYARGVQPAQIVTTGFNVTQSARVSASHQMGRRIRLSAFASQTRTNYAQGQVGPLTLNRDRVTTVGGAGSLAVGQHVSVSLDAQHLERKSDVQEFSYSSDRVGITLAGRF